MFEELRRNTKTILWITVLAFIGGFIFLQLGTGGSLFERKVSPNEIGSVNGIPISTTQYQQMVSNSLENVQQQTGKDVDDATELLIRNQAWKSLVQQTLLEQEVHHRKIRVTDDEIRFAVLNQPLPSWQQIQQFQTNGKFDLTKYQAALRNPNFDTRPLEQQYRINLPLEKLQKQVMATVVVSEDELWDAYRLQNEKVKVTCVLVPSGKFQVDEDKIDDATLQGFYQGHRETYKIPEEAVVEMVRFPKAYSYDDSMGTLDLARSLLKDARGGEDFNDLISDFSEAPPNRRGGDGTAWILPSTLPDPVRNAVESMDVDSLSDVIVEPAGFHIVRLMGRQEDPTAGTQVKVADLFLPLKPSSLTEGDIYERVSQFRTDAGEHGFQEVADQDGMEVQTTRPFPKEGFVPGIGVEPRVQDFAFSSSVGDISAPIERADEWLVVRLKERQAARIPDLDEIQDRVRREVADSLRTEQARAVAQRLLEKAQQGEDLKAVAASDSVAEIEEPDPIGRLGSIRGVGNAPKVIGPIFAASQPGLIPRVLIGPSGAVIVRVDEILPADHDAFESQKATLLQSTRQRRQSQLLNDWIAELQDRAEVKDYRSGVY